MQLTSPAFGDGTAIPKQYTCKGHNVSPALTIADPPEGTASFALVVHDPDAPHGDFTHWLVWNIPPEITNLMEGAAPDAAVQGTNDFGHTHYDGPCPPHGEHRYVFELYALDDMLDLTADAPEEDVRTEIAQHGVALATLTGLFGTEETAG